MAEKPEIDPITYCTPEETIAVAGGTPAMPPPPPGPPPIPPGPYRPRDTGGESIRPW